MVDEVVLVIALGFVERFQRDHLGYDLVSEDFGLVELRNVTLGNAFLFFVSIEDCRAILRACVRTLPIQFRRIMRHGKENFEQLAVGGGRSWLTREGFPLPYICRSRRATFVHCT